MNQLVNLENLKIIIQYGIMPKNNSDSTSNHSANVKISVLIVSISLES